MNVQTHKVGAMIGSLSVWRTYKVSAACEISLKKPGHECSRKGRFNQRNPVLSAGQMLLQPANSSPRKQVAYQSPQGKTFTIKRGGY